MGKASCRDILSRVLKITEPTLIYGPAREILRIIQKFRRDRSKGQWEVPAEGKGKGRGRCESKRFPREEVIFFQQFLVFET